MLKTSEREGLYSGPDDAVKLDAIFERVNMAILTGASNPDANNPKAGVFSVEFDARDILKMVGTIWYLETRLRYWAHRAREYQFKLIEVEECEDVSPTNKPIR